MFDPDDTFVRPGALLNRRYRLAERDVRIRVIQPGDRVAVAELYGRAGHPWPEERAREATTFDPRGDVTLVALDDVAGTLVAVGRIERQDDALPEVVADDQEVELLLAAALRARARTPRRRAA